MYLQTRASNTHKQRRTRARVMPGARKINANMPCITLSACVFGGHRRASGARACALRFVCARVRLCRLRGVSNAHTEEPHDDGAGGPLRLKQVQVRRQERRAVQPQGLRSTSAVGAPGGGGAVLARCRRGDGGLGRRLAEVREAEALVAAAGTGAPWADAALAAGGFRGGDGGAALVVDEDGGGGERKHEDIVGEDNHRAEDAKRGDGHDRGHLVGRREKR